MKKNPSQFSNKSLIFPLFLLIISIVFVVVTALQPKEDAALVAVILQPGSGIAEASFIAQAAQATIVRGGAFSNIWVLGSLQPGLAKRLRQAGVWLLLDPIAGGCVGTNQTK